MMQATIKISIVPWELAQAQAYPIRLAVFVEEQGVPKELELDEEDQLAWHAVAEHNGLTLGTARLQQDGKIGRMAVLQAYRRQGVASAMLHALLNYGQQQGIEQFYLHAQMGASGFYEHLGFKTNGPIFNEAGIAHQLMVKFT
jgi:predicted GNAT family N-acyltransferase